MCANAAVLTWFLIITNYPNSQSRASLIARVPPLRCYVTKMMEFDRCVPHPVRRSESIFVIQLWIEGAPLVYPNHHPLSRSTSYRLRFVEDLPLVFQELVYHRKFSCNIDFVRPSSCNPSFFRLLIHAQIYCV